MSRLLVAAFVLALLGACAHDASAPPTAGAFHDERFRAPSQPVDIRRIFALSPEMQRYLDGPLGDAMRAKGAQQGLVDALYRKGQLRITYEASNTRTAAETFAARSGNCLSLVLMTAAFAKASGLTVQYQSVDIDETWSRAGGIYFNLGHVNLTLGRGLTSIKQGEIEISRLMTIDFLAPADLHGQRTEEITEERIVAMFLNNRAAEALAQARLDDAYWWAREAIVQDPTFLSSYNTLGVIFRHHGDLDAARDVLSRVLDVDPRNRQALANLAIVLGQQGDTEQAAAVTRRLEAIERVPPFFYFEKGLAALERHDDRTAADFFSRELSSGNDYHEVHFWLAVALSRLGNRSGAHEQLEKALANATTRADQDLYAAKLTRMESTSTH